MELTEQLTELVTLATDNKTQFAKLSEEVKHIGAAQPETKEAIEKIQSRMEKIQTQLDAADLAANAARISHGGSEEKSVGELFVESEEFKASKSADFMPLRSRDGRIRVGIPSFFRKSTITTTSGITAATTGITVPARLPGINVIAQQELRISDLMPHTPMTTGNAFDFVRQTTRTNAASPQVETSPKAESTYAWDSVSDTVKTIAHFVNVSRQAIDDVPWLQAMLSSELTYGLKVKEESEILAGDGLGQHINGIIKQATAYATGTYNVSGDTKLDKLRHMKLQARLAGLGTFAPDGIVLNPRDMHDIELLKTEEGGANKGLYIIGDPKSGPTIKLLWGLPVVESDSMTAGTALVGAFGTAARIIDRMAAMIELSYEHSSNFTANIVTVLAEERIGLAVTRPGAFVYASSI